MKLQTKRYKIRVVAHASLHVGPDADYSAVRVHIKEFQSESPDGSVISSDVTDCGTTPVDAREAPIISDSRIHIGQIRQSNVDFIDVTKSGAGITKDIITDPLSPFSLMDTLFVQEPQQWLFPDKPPNADLARWLAEKTKWNILYFATEDPEPVKISATKITTYGDPPKNEITRYTVQGPGQIKLEFTTRQQCSGIAYADKHMYIDPRQRPLLDSLQEQQLLMSQLATSDGGQMRNPLTYGDLVALHWRTHARIDLVFARVNKVLSTVTLVSQNAAQAAGAAGVALAAAFIILNFVNREWVGGAFGAADLALGIAATSAVAGPGFVGDNPLYCNRPEFAPRRDFVLPVINRTAASIYDRIIPAPGGDCKLIDTASNAQSIPVYNLTITCFPVSIACNLSTAAAGDPSIPNLAANGYTNASAAIVFPANDSTAHQAGAYIAPPPTIPFAVAFNAFNAVCITSPSSATFCLPDGTYDQPTSLMGYTITSANAVTVPPGGSLTLQQAQKPRRTKQQPETLTTSQDSPSSGFATATKNIDGSSNPNVKLQFTMSLPPAVKKPPAACFFTKSHYLGDVFYMGPGGAPFEGPEANSTYSIGVYGGATVWIMRKSMAMRGVRSWVVVFRT
ncbi:MAG: hypothetical protein Q9166_007216 [cf. Caloplaca sp. 2 TL-2023]